MIAKPIISIIIPVYNGSNYLGEAIRSALAQTSNKVEVIVVDDGSTDGGETEAVAKSFGNKIRYYKKKNGRVASALNYGISKMRGDWFAWLSHDDVFLPDKSEIEIKYINQYPTIKVFYGNTAVINAKGKEVSSNNPITPHKVTGGIWYFRSWMYGCSMLIHKDCFKKVGLFNVTNRTAQDVEMALALLSRYTFLHIPRIVSKRRDHDASDFHQLRELNISEGDEMMKNLIDTKGIEYFFPDLNNSKTPNQKFALAYNELAGRMIRGNPKFADYCYERSLDRLNTVFNPALLAKLTGAKNIKIMLNIYYFIRNSLRGLSRKAGHVLHFWI